MRALLSVVQSSRSNTLKPGTPVIVMYENVPWDATIVSYQNSGEPNVRYSNGQEEANVDMERVSIRLQHMPASNGDSVASSGCREPTQSKRPRDAAEDLQVPNCSDWQRSLGEREAALAKREATLRAETENLQLAKSD